MMTVAAVPEPGEWLLMLCGLGLISIYLNTSQKRFVGFDDGGITVRRLKPQRLDSFCSFLVACYRDLLSLRSTTFCNLLAGKLTMNDSRWPISVFLPSLTWMSLVHHSEAVVKL